MSDKPKENDQTDYLTKQDSIQSRSVWIFATRCLRSLPTLCSLWLLSQCIFNQSAADIFGILQSCLSAELDWVFMIGVNIYLLFCTLLIVSPVGKVRIGGKDAKPEYSYLGWFAMLFAAGMGIGLVFFGVLEPMNHSLKPPLNWSLGLVDDAGNIIPANIEKAQRYGHGGHLFSLEFPWLGDLFGCRPRPWPFSATTKNCPCPIRSALHPLLGRHTWGWPGHLIDISAVFATLAGLATSLGFGAEQASAGLGYIFGFTAGIGTKIIIVMIITVIALFSILRGLDGGIKLLSEINLTMALILMCFVLFYRPDA